MVTTWRYEDSGDYLLVRVVGVYRSGAPSIPSPDEVAAQARVYGRWRVLIDLTALDGNIPSIDRFTLGETAGRVWRRKLKVAIAARPGTVTRFFENVAVNAGANVQVFEDYAAALEWLLRGGLVQ